MITKQGALLILLFLLQGMLLKATFAADVSVTVSDQKNKKMRNVVVFLEPLFALKHPPKPVDKLIDQRDKEFIPFVTAVQVGTSIRFPNNDRIRHHVYSFSEAKSFELPLYSGAPPKSVQINKAGIVTLGCNIHDWMLAYIYVAETPFFAKTNAQGKAILKNLPKGAYQLTVWHPQKKGSVLLKKSLQIPMKTTALSFQMHLKAHWRNLNKKPKKTSPLNFYDNDDGYF